MNKELIKLANALDEAGFKKEADQIDALIKRRALLLPAAAPAASPMALALLFLLFSVVTLSIPQEAWQELVRRLREAVSNDNGPSSIPIENDPYQEGVRDGLEKIQRVLEKELQEESEDNSAGSTTETEDAIRQMLKKVKEALNWPGRGPAPIPIPDGLDDIPDNWDEGEVRVSCVRIHQDHRSNRPRTPTTHYYYYDKLLSEDFAYGLCEQMAEMKGALVNSVQSEFQKDDSFIRDISDYRGYGTSKDRMPTSEIQRKRIVDWAKGKYGPHVSHVTIYDHSYMETHRCQSGAHKKEEQHDAVKLYCSTIPRILIATEY